ncbi:hypothetical protein GCM10009828_063750 [Actinoplanes couchii]|uniref:Uncharacterized protein n=1 Tax=Actinoplanes couchii TaxID=403638 RepID=A0ABQ3X3C0_9ACTN|nr:hypothetical protein Aco03nite_014040 [Actinoplanes couchii]
MAGYLLRCCNAAPGRCGRAGILAVPPHLHAYLRRLFVVLRLRGVFTLRRTGHPSQLPGGSLGRRIEALLGPIIAVTGTLTVADAAFS